MQTRPAQHAIGRVPDRNHHQPPNGGNHFFRRRTCMSQNKTQRRKNPAKTGESLRKQAIAEIDANISRIEAAESGEAIVPLEFDAVPITQIMSAGSPSPRKAGRAASSKSRKVRAGKIKGAKTTKPAKSKAP